jgi:hypothetical protein
MAVIRFHSDPVEFTSSEVLYSMVYSALEHARQNHDGTLGLLNGAHSNGISLEIFPHKG